MAGRARTIPAAALAIAGAVLAGCEEGAGHHRVDMRGLAFVPEAIEVVVGDTVTWTNQDYVPHTVSDPTGSLESGELRQRGAFSWIAGQAGTVEYRCRYHPTMTGQVIVR